MLSRCECQIPLRNSNGNRTSRPSTLSNRKLIVTPNQNAEKAVDYSYRLLITDPVFLEINMDRLHILLCFGHKDQMVLIKLNQHFLFGPSNLGINAYVQESRPRGDAERLVPRLLDFFSIVL